MKRYYLILVGMLLIAFIPFSYAENSNPFPLPLNVSITKMLNDIGENLNIGLVVEDLNTGSTLYKKNADRYFMPASNAKLFTALAALEYLGPEFVYQTRLYVDKSKIQNGTLNDNIYIQFSGDPNLKLEQFDRLIASLSQAGIHRINGSIIIDDTAFDQVSMSPGTSWEDKNYCFGSPVSALNINHNCVTAYLKPALRSGTSPTLILPHEPQFVRFINSANTDNPSAHNCKPRIELTDEMTYTISGCVKTTDQTQQFDVPVLNPRLNMQATLIYLLNKNLIGNTHDIKFQKIFLPPAELAHTVSVPVQALVKKMLKDSDNLIANTLFKTMGALYSNNQGTWENGNRAIHSILSGAIPADFSKPLLTDGAGTSRYDFVTPQHIIALLRKAYSKPYRNTFISALPISGIDGTLKGRMNNAKTIKKVYAKTGSMTAVTALSGYLITRNQHTLIFTILINGFVDSDQKYKALEDRICSVLVDF